MLLLVYKDLFFAFDLETVPASSQIVSPLDELLNRPPNVVQAPVVECPRFLPV
jgi:hypothetical protein